MALASLQLCQKCFSLLRMRRSPVELVVRAKAQYPVTVSCSSIFPRCSTDPRLPLASLNGSLLAQKCRAKWISRSCTFSDWCSTVLPSREDQRQPEDSTEHSLVPNQRCESDQATVDVLSLSDCQVSLGDLDSAAALSPFDDIDDEEAVKINGQPALPPVAISLRDYVSQSETLRQLVLLGVNLSMLEQRLNVGSMLLRLDFQEDVRERLLFLKDMGVKDSELGPLITQNPFVLTESLENLEARVLFLKSKKFSQEAIAAMVYKAPYLLNFSIQRLDNRLAFFQKSLGLSAQKTVDIMTRLPRLLCRSLEPVKENLKVFELELGFRENEIQHIVTRIPKVLTANKKRLTETFHYIHKTMGIPHSLIVKFPQVLNSKLLRIKERHLFLHYLGRAQYDPTQPSYIALEHIVSLPDEVFCTKVALASLEDFELFLKTL